MSARSVARRTLAIAAACVVFLLGLLLFCADGIGRRIVVSALDGALTTDSRIEEVRASPFRGKLTLTDLQVDDGDRFGPDPILRLSSARARIALGSLSTALLRITEVRLRKPRLSLRLDENGDSNLREVLTANDPAQAERGDGKSVLLEQVRIEKGRLSFRDAAADPVSFELEELELRLYDLLFAAQAGGEQPGERMPADLRLRGELVGADERAPFLICALLEPIEAGSPRTLRLDLYAAGIDLRTFTPYLTPAAATLLGGRFLDLDLRVEVEADRLRGSLRLLSDGGEQYSLPLGGTLDRPRLLDDPGVLAAFQLPRQKLSRLLGTSLDLGQGAGERLEAAADAALDSARQVGDATTRLGRPLVDGVEGAAQGVVEAAGKLGETLTRPRDVGRNTVEAVRKAGQGGRRLIEGVFGSGKKVVEGGRTVLSGGAETAAAVGNQLPDRVLDLRQVLDRNESDSEREARRAATHQRFLQAARDQLTRHRAAAVARGDEATRQRVDAELAGLATGEDG